MFFLPFRHAFWHHYSSVNHYVHILTTVLLEGRHIDGIHCKEVSEWSTMVIHLTQVKWNALAYDAKQKSNELLIVGHSYLYSRETKLKRIKNRTTYISIKFKKEKFDNTSFTNVIFVEEVCKHTYEVVNFIMLAGSRELPASILMSVRVICLFIKLYHHHFNSLHTP